METIESSLEMQRQSLDWRARGAVIGLVPTMGFLHEGHLKLVDTARQRADRVVMSVFVNPKQFGPSEDFEKYPRDLERDADLAASRGVDAFFAPGVHEIYPDGDQTQVLVTDLTRGLDGAFRPGHFRGVTTVVAKLFLIVQPHLAVFGEKDYQQLVIIRRMVRDLHFPIDILGEPTVRDPDGLAMSSRNSYLSAQEREEALHIHQALLCAQEALSRGERQAERLVQAAKEELSKGPHLTPDYVEIVDVQSLLPLKIIDRPARMLLALHLNGKRLIDNGPLVP